MEIVYLNFETQYHLVVSFFYNKEPNWDTSEAGKTHKTWRNNLTVNTGTIMFFLIELNYISRS